MHAITVASRGSTIQRKKLFINNVYCLFRVFIQSSGRIFDPQFVYKVFPGKPFSFLYWKIEQENFVSDSVKLGQIK